jgi:predicted KAP-like P-loop ATPase
MQDELAISLLSHVSGKLGADETLKKIVSGLGNRLFRTLPSIGGIFGGDIAKEGIEKFTSMLSANTDSAEQIVQLKEGISKSVKNKLQKTGKNRIVIFIDDLDRLLPEKAVELLEVLKLFLDVPDCVYVLACVIFDIIPPPKGHYYSE